MMPSTQCSRKPVQPWMSVVVTIILWCHVPTVVYASEASSFMGSFLTSLSLAQQAKEKAAEAKAGDPLGQETSLRFAISELEKAKLQLQPYTQSKHETVKESATRSIRTYELLMAKYQDSGTLLDQVYLLEHEKQGLGTEAFIMLKNRASQLAVDIENGWGQVIENAAFASQVIVKRSNDGAVGRLLLDKHEQGVLLDQLDALFPQTKAGPESGQPKTVAAAALIRNTLYEFSLGE